MLSDRRRHELFVALSTSIGQEPAEALMELLPSEGWGDIVRIRDIDAFRADVDARFAIVDARFDRLDAKIDAQFAKVDAQFARVDAKVDRQFAHMVWANLAMLVATVSVVLAAGAGR